MHRIITLHAFYLLCDPELQSQYMHVRHSIFFKELSRDRRNRSKKVIMHEAI
jgi:hypothetical protein